jgi:hypothetical protein
MGKKMYQRASSMAIRPDNNLSKLTEKPTTKEESLGGHSQEMT